MGRTIIVGKCYPFRTPKHSDYFLSLRIQTVVDNNDLPVLDTGFTGGRTDLFPLFPKRQISFPLTYPGQYGCLLPLM